VAVIVGQSHVNLIAPGATSAATSLFLSLPFARAPNASIVTMVMQADQAGTMDVEALRYAGNIGIATDWYRYNTTGEQVAVVAGQPARVTIWGGAPVMRIRYTPSSPAAVAWAEAYYTTHGANG